MTNKKRPSLIAIAISALVLGLPVILLLWFHPKETFDFVVRALKFVGSGFLGYALYTSKPLRVFVVAVVAFPLCALLLAVLNCFF